MSSLCSRTAAQLSADLALSRITSRRLVEIALEKIAEPTGEGSRAFMKVYRDAALTEADASDRLRELGIVRSPIEGLPISVKDLFDVGGDVTLAGSKALEGSQPAKHDAVVVSRLRAAGAIIIGRTATVEFAFGGVGTNPHFGTPQNPFERSLNGGRVPGGSSSGAAVAVADGMGIAGIGSDTRGSVRIPAALCGLVGFKPTAERVPRNGVFPLSYSLDSVGPIGHSVGCAALFDRIMSSPPGLTGTSTCVDSLHTELSSLPLSGLRLLVPQCSLFDDVEAPVTAAFEAAVTCLEAAGARVAHADAAVLTETQGLFKDGGFAGPEAAYIHRDILRTRRHLYDPRVASRIALGEGFSAADYVALSFKRKEMISRASELLAPYDAMLYPTTPCIAPLISQVEQSDEEYVKWNLRLLRNPGLINMLDGCALTLPCHAPGKAPVGFSIAGMGGTDQRVLAIGHAVEQALRNMHS
uniref:Amidase domain-containing protein n=1 Tax=Chrysotila carterae TaxID=13221 RepID=A0A7S4C180_CHRCT